MKRGEVVFYKVAGCYVRLKSAFDRHGFAFIDRHYDVDTWAHISELRPLNDKELGKQKPKES